MWGLRVPGSEAPDMIEKFCAIDYLQCFFTTLEFQCQRRAIEGAKQESARAAGWGPPDDQRPWQPSQNLADHKPVTRAAPGLASRAGRLIARSRYLGSLRHFGGMACKSPNLSRERRFSFWLSPLPGDLKNRLSGPIWPLNVEGGSRKQLHAKNLGPCRRS